MSILTDQVKGMTVIDYCNQEAEGEIAYEFLFPVVSEFLWLATNGNEPNEQLVKEITDQIIYRRNLSLVHP